MSKFLKNKNGFILAVVTLAIIFVLGLSAAFFMRSVSEKRFADLEKFNIQAEFLAEAGANHALSELRQRIKTDLNARISQIRSGAVINDYYASDNPLGLLRDYAYEAGDSQLVISGTQATLSLVPLNLIDNIDGNYVSQITLTSGGHPDNPSPDTYIFYYKYAVQGTGTSTAITPNISKDIFLLGDFSINIRRDNFAKFALFTNHHRAPAGQTVWFTERTNFYGPVSTNDRFSFANNPSAHFTHEVTQHLTKAQYYNEGSYISLDDDHNGTKDVPIFDMGFKRGEPIIDLESAVTSSDLRAQALGTMSEPGSKGIYVPSDINGNLTGGIYIRGTSNVALGVDAGNNPQYTISRGSTTKVITVNYAANTTTVQTLGGSTDTYSGIPDGVDNEGIIIYGKDDIESLSGMVQRDSDVTISSERDIVIANHIRYQDYNPGSPLTAEGYDNILGILSWGGNVRIGTSAPSNVEIHGIVMAPHGIFTVDDYDEGSPRGTATLLGGVITDFYGPFGTFRGSTPLSGYGRNFLYDERVLSGQVPPYFPYLENFISTDDGGLDIRPTWRKD